MNEHSVTIIYPTSWLIPSCIHQKNTPLNSQYSSLPCLVASLHHIWLLLIMSIDQIRARKKQHREIKVAETLMDVLLKNWTYFEHTHGDVKMVSAS